MLVLKSLDLESVAKVGQPAPFELTLPYHDYNFSRRLFKLNHNWGIPTEDEVGLIASFLEKTPSKILDLACGGGRHALSLAKMGHMVLGIDIGGYPIRMATRIAKRKNLRAEFITADIRELEVKDKYDLAFLICGQLAHFSPQEGLDIFARTSRALDAGGIFIVHLNRFTPADRVNCFKWYQELKPLYMKHPSLVHREQYYFEKERVKTIRDFAIDSATHENRLFGISEKEYSLEEISQMGSCSNFTLMNAFGDYHKSPLTPESPGMILVFRKNESLSELN
jgi:ubiquinone/menaquinone biosynthesis C-methylase UbiE